MARCAGKKGDGSPCERIVPEGVEYCFGHDPTKAEARRANASKAGRTKSPNVEIQEVKAQLRKLTDDVVAGRLSTGRGSVAAQLLGVLQKWVEQERKNRELEELSKRVTELEEQQAQNMGGWSAEYGW